MAILLQTISASSCIGARAVFCGALALVVFATQGAAQDGSLLHTAAAPTPPQQQQVPLPPQQGSTFGIAPSLANSSFMYRKLPPEAEFRELQINDIVTVLVDYRSSMISEGDAESRRNLSLNAVLADWLAFDGKDLYAAPQERGNPRINGTLQSQYRTESEMELRDALTFRIAAAVVDIRPNGNLVVEARREIRINEEVWIQSLTGVVRRQSIGPDRTVRSDEVAELRIEKREKGFVNDSYSRGWFTRWYDKWKPF